MPTEPAIAAGDTAFVQIVCVADVTAISLHLDGADIKALERDRRDEAGRRLVSFRGGANPRRPQEVHYLTPSPVRGA